MSEPFDAIGFQVSDQATYEALAVKARQHGAISRMHREQAVLHGCCWRLGEGLEVWTVMHESRAGLVYADCRPAFRGRQTVSLHPWEILEFAEEGEAVVRAEIAGTRQELIFELQNLTEINPAALRHQPLTATVAGLAYKVQFHKRKLAPHCLPLRLRYPRRNFNENDYSIRGTVLASRALRNPLTTDGLIWVQLDLGTFHLELLLNRSLCPDALPVGAHLTAEVWLQGYILTEHDLRLRYEGVDPEIRRADCWQHLRHRL